MSLPRRVGEKIFESGRLSPARALKLLRRHCEEVDYRGDCLEEIATILYEGIGVGGLFNVSWEDYLPVDIIPLIRKYFPYPE